MENGQGSSNNGDEVAKALREQLKAMQLKLKEQMARSVDVLHAQIISNLRGGILARRTGSLMNSFKKKVKKEGDSYVGTITAEGVPYALIHEFGGVIKPKKAKNLVFPVEENRKSDGSPRVSLDEVFKNKSHFFYKNILWIEKIKQGRLKRAPGLRGALGGKTRGESKHTGVIPMFYFRKSVTIPKRPYIQPALAAKREEIMKNFGVFLALSFKEKKE